MRSVDPHPYLGRFTRRAVLLTALLGSWVAAAPARAETGEPPAPRSAPVAALLRDDRAIAEWLKQRHHDVLAAEARILQARADQGTARLLLPNPVLDVGVGGLAFNPSAGFGTAGNFGVGLTQTIELGKRGKRIESANLRAEESEQAFLDTLGDRVGVARTAMARAAYLKAKMAVLADNLTGAKHLADLQKARADRGQVSGNDFDRLLLDNISLEADIARSRSDLEGALAACAQTMLATCDVASAGIADVDAAAPVPADVAAMGADIEKRPDVVAARLEGAAAESDAVLAGRRAIPDPSLRVGYYRDNTQLLGGVGYSPNSVQLTLSVPLPLFDHGQYDSARARAHALEQRHVAEGLVVGARSDFAGLISRKAFLESALATLDKVAVPKSSAILETTIKALDQGAVNMTDLLLARRTHLSLVLSQMDMHFEYFGVRNDLRHTLGLDTMGMSADRPAPPPPPADTGARSAPRVVGSR